MVFGMSLETYTLIHVLISLAGIGSGLVVLYGLLTGKRLDAWTALFLVTTVATSVTGFGFPVDHLLPSHKVGIISLLLLAVAILARYAFDLNGAWRVGYVISAAMALYLNVFVGGGAVFREGGWPEGAGPDADRTPISGCATCRPVTVHGTHYSCGSSLSPGAAPHCLIN